MVKTMLRTQAYLWLGILAAYGTLTLATAFAGGAGCDQCSANGQCSKVCRLICEEKEVEITCWGCKCEDICVPDRSQRGCKHCEQVCGDGDDCEIAAHPKKFVWYDWIPGCASTKTRKRLMRKTETRKVPTYRWVVEDACPCCETVAPSGAP
jgi:hypothetical protein